MVWTLDLQLVSMNTLFGVLDPSPFLSREETSGGPKGDITHHRKSRTLDPKPLAMSALENVMGKLKFNAEKKT